MDTLFDAIPGAIFYLGAEAAGGGGMGQDAGREERAGGEAVDGGRVWEGGEGEGVLEKEKGRVWGV